MFYTIYEVVHVESAKKYIGKHQTKDLDDGYMGSGKYLKRAIDRYGVNNFKKTIIHIFDTEEEMNSKEAELVTEEFCERDDTYNLCPGGRGGWGYINKMRLGGTKGKSQTEKQKYLAREWMVENQHRMQDWGTPKRLELIKKLNMIWEGRKHTEETKAKMSGPRKKSRGSNNSQFGTMWITDGNENRKIKKDLTIPEGWYKGRVTKTTAWTKYATGTNLPSNRRNLSFG